MIKKLFQSQWVKGENAHSLLVHVKNKLSFILLFGLLLFLPTQLGYHVWPSWAYVSGQRIDYLSPTIFISDVFIFLLLIVTIFTRQFSFSKREACMLFLIVSFLLLTVIFSSSPLAGWYGVIKLIEVVFVAWYIKGHVREVVVILSIVLPIALVVESILALWQFMLQRSIGGLWYFLGERTFSASTPGIANASFGGSLVLRPYATFPHPNVLAGFLLIGVLFLTVFLKQQTKVRRYLWLSIIVLSSITLLVTLSRTGICLWLCIGLTFLVQVVLTKTKKEKLFYGVLGGIFLVVISLLLLPRFATLTGESLLLREQLFSVGWQMFVIHPLLGVGVNNFFVNESLLAPTVPLQPVHNVFMLVLSQTGIIGLLLFSYLLFMTVNDIITSSFESQFRKNIRKFSLFALGIFVCIGMVDHYFFTLQQGQLLTALIFGFSWSGEKN